MGKINQNSTVFVTGGSGFLGCHLCDQLRSRFDVHASYNSNPCSLQHCRTTQLDITDHDHVVETISQCSPSLIVHAAAVSSPDVCERDPSRAWAVNVDGTKNLITAAMKRAVPLIYVSTDMVFSGQEGNYTENDDPAPINFYGKTKREAEIICRKASDTCTIVRITLQYGRGRGTARSFSDWLLHNLSAGSKVPLFYDQYRTPTYVKDTVRGIEIIALNGKPGDLYHLAGPDRIDRHSFGRMFAAVFSFPESLLKRTAMADVPSAAARPKDVSLDGKKFTDQFNFFPRGVYDGIRKMSREYAETT